MAIRSRMTVGVSFFMALALGLFLGQHVGATQKIPPRKPGTQQAAAAERATRHDIDQPDDLAGWGRDHVPPRKPETPRFAAQPETTRGATPKTAQSTKMAAIALPFAKADIPPLTRKSGIRIGNQFKPKFSLSEAKFCEKVLAQQGVQFTVAKALDADGKSCGWERPLAISQLPGGVKVHGDLKLRCEAALALALWTKEVVIPSGKRHLGAKVNGYDIGASYHCRRRNNARSGKLSEHAFANAIDIMAIRFNPRPTMKIKFQSDRKEKAFQKEIRDKSCEYFTTVLGPGSDAAHKDHFHLDMAVRKRAYRYCK